MEDLYEFTDVELRHMGNCAPSESLRQFIKEAIDARIERDIAATQMEFHSKMEVLMSDGVQKQFYKQYRGAWSQEELVNQYTHWVNVHAIQYNAEKRQVIDALEGLRQYRYRQMEEYLAETG